MNFIKIRALPDEKRRWIIVFIIFLIITFNYVDRQLLSILKPMLEKEFNIGDQTYALIVNLFTICYALMYPVSGWVVDKFGPRIVMFFGLITWSIASIGGGLSRTVGHFGFFRALLGLGEPANFPAQLKVVTVWFSGKLRATANSLCTAGGSVGAIIAPPLVVWLATRYNWETPFIVVGIVGLILAFVWLLIYRDPPKHIAKKSAESTGISTEVSFSWKNLWKTKTLWAVILIRFLSDPVWYFILFWLPGYLQDQSGLSLSQIGMFGWIPFLVADLGGISSSAWSDWMVRKGKTPLKARKIMLTTTALAAPLCFVIPYISNDAISTIVVFCFIGAMCTSWLYSMGVVIAEAYPVKNVSSVLGIAAGFGALGATIFNYFIGQFIGTLGAGKLFIIMAFLHPMAVLILWTLIKGEKPKKSQKQMSQID